MPGRYCNRPIDETHAISIDMILKIVLLEIIAFFERPTIYLSLKSRRLVSSATSTRNYVLGQVKLLNAEGLDNLKCFCNTS